ncbi:hypothetical protein [Glycomyces sp. NPDC047010]|uniref:hypothetical protein n=1 Tax=Glycomyces sp. NPDC047010 TaxID=3155023 RepID=UPI0034110106
MFAVPTPVPDPTWLQLLETGPSAQMYGSLASVLAGFAFTGLVLYLERQSGAAEGGGDAVRPVHIVKTLFYAMCALTVCAFLYARLAGELGFSDRVLLGLSFYGLVLAPAVLSLFYALNLVMRNHEVTRATAESTRWVVAGAGPAVVISLLADPLDNAWDYGCAGSCPAWASPRLWGCGLALAFLAIGLMLTVPERPNRALTWVLHLAWIDGAKTRLLEKPHFPALMTLWLASATGMASLLVRGTPDVLDPRLWAHAVLVLAVAFMAVFAFATGSVLEPRRHPPDRAGGPGRRFRPRPLRRLTTPEQE